MHIYTRNASLNYLKSKQRDREQEDDTFLEFEFGIKQGVVAAIHKAIEELPEECRKVFKLLYYEELILIR